MFRRGVSVWTAPPALRDLAMRYALAVDTRNPEMLAAIFTTDGVMSAQGSAEVLYAAPDGWGRMIAAMDASFGQTLHNVFNQTFERDGEGAVTGLTTGIASHILPGDGGDLVDFAMRYHDRYAEEGGVWKFRERRLEVVWIEERKVRPFSAEIMSRVLKGF